MAWIDDINNFLGAGVTGVSQDASALAGAVQHTVENNANAAASVASSASNAVSNAAQTASNTVIAQTQAGLNAVNNAVQGVENALSGAIQHGADAAARTFTTWIIVGAVLAIAALIFFWYLIRSGAFADLLKSFTKVASAAAPAMVAA